MKTASPGLWHLIRSMNRNEKLFFKKKGASSIKTSLYIKLFDAITTQKKYDEETLLKACPFYYKKEYCFSKTLPA